MISTIEKVLFLKSVDLFSQIAGGVLVRVAQIAEVVRFEPGEAMTNVSVLKLEREDFYDLMSDKLEIAHGIIKVLTRRLRNANAP